VVVPDEALMLAEVLKRNGFYTYAYSTNAMLVEEKGMAQGFDEFFFGPALGEWVTTITVNRFEKGEIPQPFFAWLHYIDPHGPYDPPRRFGQLFVDDRFYDAKGTVQLGEKNHVLGEVPGYQQELGENAREQELDFYVARYDGEVRYLDAQISRLFLYLEENNLLNNTIVVFTADHGESLGDHNYYFEHGLFVYQHQIHVPLFIRLPGQQVGSRIEQPVQLLDLAPTLLELTGIPVPGSYQGRSLVPALAGRRLEDSPVYSQTPENLGRYKCVRMGWWKYIVDERGNEELYNLEDDPGETINLIDDRRDLANLLDAQLAHQDKAAKRADEVRELPFDKMDKASQEQLKALGYIQ
jgi:arylsulfatase A-like enzyme